MILYPSPATLWVLKAVIALTWLSTMPEWESERLSKTRLRSQKPNVQENTECIGFLSQKKKMRLPGNMVNFQKASVQGRDSFSLQRKVDCNKDTKAPE